MIVGLYSSLPQSGKTTVKDAFVRAGFTPLSFASPVKESLFVVLSGLGVEAPERYLWGDWKHKVIPGMYCTGGFLMSAYATSFMRDTISQDIWVNILLQKIQNGINYVVDDLRFPNEFAIMDYTVNIIRPDVEPRHGRLPKSEGQLDDYRFDYLIENTGTLNDLYLRVEAVIFRIKNK